MRIMPYRTTDNRIDGAVLTFSFIDEQIKSQQVLKTTIHEIDQAWELVRAVFDMNTDPMLVLDKDGKMVIANTAISELIGISQENIRGTDFFDFQVGISEQTDLKSKFKTASKQAKNFITEAFEVKSSDGNQRFRIDGHIIKKDKNFPYRILLRFIKQR
jgi:two-component system CheB/CheR fusion protein